jgi:lipoprotein-releasing system permease protein
MVFRLALRNALRNRRRTLLTALAISLSFALLIVFTGIADGAHEKIAELGVSMGLGDVVVQARGYEDDPTLDHLIRDPNRVERALAGLPGVAHVAPRLRTEGLIESGTTSLGVTVSGVDPAVEPLASKIDTPTSMIAGHCLEPEPQRPAGELVPIVLGAELAKTLDVHVGDRVTLTVSPVGGGEARTGAFRVGGIFKTGVEEVDAFWVEMPLDAAQTLIGAGHGVTMVAALLHNISNTPQATERARASLSDASLEVLPWTTAAPDLHSAIVIDEGYMYLMMAIVFVVVAAGILNTLLMGVLERTHEFGVLLALGTSPRRVVGIVLAEAVLLGLGSVAVGLGLGLLGNHHFATVGFDVASALGGNFEASGVLLPKRLYAHLWPCKVVWSSIVIVALVVLGAVYPAFRAARLQPVEAIRHE